jgi:hypothetical protein
VLIDLHLHTHHSDGVLSPRDLLTAVRKAGVDRFAVTDHDTMRGWAALAGEAGLIPGVEITAGHHGREIHIVGLGIDPGNAALTTLLTNIRACRIRRLTVLIDRLPDEVRRGLTMADLASDPAARQSDTLGRLHLAKSLLRRGGIATIGDAFSQYLGDEHTSDSELEAFPDVAAVAAYIQSAGGVAILAHPGVYKDLSLIKVLVTCGLDGIEVNHPNLDPSLHADLLSLARERQLLISSGSDLHFLGRRTPGDWSLGDAHQALLERLAAA